MEALEPSWFSGLEGSDACSDARSCDSLRRFFNRPPKLGMENEGRGPREERERSGEKGGEGQGNDALISLLSSFGSRTAPLSDIVLVLFVLIRIIELRIK